MNLQHFLHMALSWQQVRIGSSTRALARLRSAEIEVRSAEVEVRSAEVEVRTGGEDGPEVRTGPR